MRLWKPKPSTEAEFDIEGLNVYAVEREDDGDTLISYMRGDTETEFWCSSTDDQHRAFVARLTAKLAKRDAAK